MRQQTVESFRTPDPKTNERLHMAVAYYIATCNRPYNTVTKDGFRLMLKAFKNGYEPPGRKSLTETHIPRLYRLTKDILKTALSNASSVALTTDTWTSEAGESYISLTSHIIDSEWKMRSFTLCCRTLNVNHTAVNLKEWLEEAFKEWGLDIKKVSAITSDNGANVCRAVDLTGLPNVRCLGHTLQNGIADVEKFPEVKALKMHTHALQHYFASEKVWRSYKSCIEGRHKKTPRKLRGPCPTRWWSEVPLYKVLISEEHYHREFLAVHDNGRKLSLLLTEESMSYLKEFTATLEPLEELSRAMSSESYVTASGILPVLYLIEKMLQTQTLSLQPNALSSSINDVSDTMSEEDDDFTPVPAPLNKHVMQAILAKLKKRYCCLNQSEQQQPSLDADAANAKELHAFLVKCSYLDPRFRQDLSETDVLLAKNQLIAEMETASPSRQSGSAAVSPEPRVPKKKGLASIFEKLSGRSVSTDSEVAEPTHEEKMRLELLRYDVLPSVAKDEDVLLWWRDHVCTLPILSAKAKKYLCVPATSTPSERVFSNGGDVITDERVCLTGEHAEQLIFLAMNKDYVPKPK